MLKPITLCEIKTFLRSQNFWPADTVQTSPESHLIVSFKFQDSDAFHGHSECQLAKFQDLEQS